MNKYDLSNKIELANFDNKVKWLRDNKKYCELKHIKKTRSTRQNSSLHLYIKFITDNLNEMGITFNYTGLKGFDIETRWTEVLVKECLIKPICLALFNKDSTTKLTTDDLNEVITTINNFFSERGVYIPWPSIQSIIDYDKNSEYFNR